MFCLHSNRIQVIKAADLTIRNKLSASRARIFRHIGVAIFISVYKQRMYDGLYLKFMPRSFVFYLELAYRW